MDAKPSTQDQLLHSTSALSTAIASFKSSNVPEFHSLKDGLSALQDKLWASRGVSNQFPPPFYMVCLLLCNALSGELSECHVANLKSVSVMGHNLSQISTRLLELFHALNTFLNMRYCIKANLDTRSFQICMSCVSRSIHDLDDYRTHLKRLEENILVMSHLVCAETCLEIYLTLCKELGVTSDQPTFCECISRGSNQKASYMDDIYVTRLGEVAINHFTRFGEQLLKEVDQKRGSMKDEDLEEIKMRFNEVTGRFRDASSHLKSGEILVSYELLTRGHRLDFDRIGLIGDYGRGGCSSEAE